jgi:hypothetical protein
MIDTIRAVAINIKPSITSLDRRSQADIQKQRFRQAGQPNPSGMQEMS